MSDNDFCEYVYNPLMRQYQAMIRLMQMIRSSQSADCNDIQCFTDDINDPTNPMSQLSANSSFLVTYGPMMVIWALFAFALFMFRPQSMRKTSKADKKRDPTLNSVGSNRFHDDDDDNSTVS